MIREFISALQSGQFLFFLNQFCIQFLWKECLHFKVASHFVSKQIGQDIFYLYCLISYEVS
jgi:hypothetical protein